MVIRCHIKSKKKPNMLRKIANNYWWAFLILTKNKERNLRDAFDKTIKSKKLTKETLNLF